MDFIRLAVLALCEFHVALARCEDLRAPGEPNSHTPRSKASRNDRSQFVRDPELPLSVMGATRLLTMPHRGAIHPSGLAA